MSNETKFKTFDFVRPQNSCYGKREHLRNRLGCIIDVVTETEITLQGKPITLSIPVYLVRFYGKDAMETFPFTDDDLELVENI